MSNMEKPWSVQYGLFLDKPRSWGSGIFGCRAQGKVVSIGKLLSFCSYNTWLGSKMGSTAMPNKIQCSWGTWYWGILFWDKANSGKLDIKMCHGQNMMYGLGSSIPQGDSLKWVHESLWVTAGHLSIWVYNPTFDSGRLDIPSNQISPSSSIISEQKHEMTMFNGLKPSFPLGGWETLSGSLAPHGEYAYP